MWFLSEIEIKTGISRAELLKLCDENDIKVKSAFGSDGKCLGDNISDCDHDRLFWIVRKYVLEELT